MLSGPGGLEDTATLSVLLVYLLVEGCLGLFVGGRVSRSPPGLPEADHIVWSGRTGGHRYTQCLAGLLLVAFLCFGLGVW